MNVSEGKLLYSELYTRDAFYYLSIHVTIYIIFDIIALVFAVWMNNMKTYHNNVYDK